MHKLHTRYARWFNRHAGRRGRVWADRFGSRPVRSGQHLANTIVYIDLNAVEAGLVDEVGSWQWDSAGANCGLAAPRPWHDPERARASVALGRERTTREDYLAILRARSTRAEHKPWNPSPESLSLGGQPSSRRRF
jgi:hypothetical protein